MTKAVAFMKALGAGLEGKIGLVFTRLRRPGLVRHSRQEVSDMLGVRWASARPQLHHSRDCAHEEADFDRAWPRRGQSWSSAWPRLLRASRPADIERGAEQGRAGSAQHHAGRASVAGDARRGRHACRQPVVEARSARAIGSRAFDLPRLIEGHYALQVFSSVTKSPQGQNYNANSADTDTIASLVKFQLQPEATWTLAAAALAVSCRETARLCRKLGRAAPVDQRRRPISMACSPTGTRAMTVVGGHAVDRGSA